MYMIVFILFVFISECIIPAGPEFGNLNSENDGSRLLYYCDTGYSIKGSVERNCQENGLGWDGFEPQCSSCYLIKNTIKIK